MSTVTEHYEQLLAPVYMWMVGGADEAFRAASAELAALALPFAPNDEVVDLGAGFGSHAIPLARRGARVLAVDSSPLLLDTLAELRGELPIRIVCADLIGFSAQLAAPPRAVLCMGDTLTHLLDTSAVARLFDEVAAALVPGGAFVLSFRDYTIPLAQEARFIPVRSDDHRILTCFLEYHATTVRVHDVLHERANGGWQMRVSAYTKLRLAPQDVTTMLEARSFEVRREVGARGLVRLVSIKREAS
ncbi:MAG: class I SAM-dependent methyltransferase [bacterium]